MASKSKAAVTMTERHIQGWAVSVEVNGDNILTIGHNHLSGVDDIQEYADVIRGAARHLLSFIGDGEQTPRKEG